MIPTIYDLAEAAKILGVSQSYLRSKLRDHTFAGMKRAGRWGMTEPQIEAASEAMSLDARPPEPTLAIRAVEAQQVRPAAAGTPRSLKSVGGRQGGR